MMHVTRYTMLFTVYYVCLHVVHDHILFVPHLQHFILIDALLFPYVLRCSFLCVLPFGAATPHYPFSTPLIPTVVLRFTPSYIIWYFWHWRWPFYSLLSPLFHYSPLFYMLLFPDDYSFDSDDLPIHYSTFDTDHWLIPLIDLRPDTFIIWLHSVLTVHFTLTFDDTFVSIYVIFDTLTIWCDTMMLSVVLHLTYCYWWWYDAVVDWYDYITTW